MATIPAGRMQLQFSEVMARWQWSEVDLKDAIINKIVTPTVFVKGTLLIYRQGSGGVRQQVTQAIAINDWLYLVDVRKTAPFDCEFFYLAKVPDAFASGGDLFTVVQMTPGGHLRPRYYLSSIFELCALSMDEVLRYESLHGQLHGAVKARWWNTEHNVVAIADSVKEKWKASNRDVNQSGARAGLYPIDAIGKAVAMEIAKIERTLKATGKARTIGGKTISTFLKERGWS